MIFTLEELEEKSKERPQGYKEEVLKASKKLDGNNYELDDVIFSELAKKYRLPSLLNEIKNFTQSIGDILNHGSEARSKEEIEKVLTICASCPQLIVQDFRCGACGCFLKIKSQYAAWHCVLNKW